MTFDLPAYLARIGLNEMPAANAEGLRILQRAHRLAIPFENLDILLGHGISLDPERIFDKLVRRRRGGYCFEQNALFLAALHALGFEARALLARVWLFATETPPKTHQVILVTLAGEEWIADAGFGGSYTPPIRLAEGEAESSDGARFRLITDREHGWMLARWGDEDWQPQYSFTTDRVWPTDIAMANHFVSTEPDSRFVTSMFVTTVLPHGFASLINRDYHRSSAKGDERSEISSAKMLQLRLSLVFGIDLTDLEIAALGQF